MTITPKKHFTAEYITIILLLPTTALAGIAVAWMLGLWRPELIWVPAICIFLTILFLYFEKAPKLGTIHISESGLAIETMAEKIIPWGSISEISYSEAAPEKPAFLILEPLPGHILPVPDTGANTISNPPMVFNRSGNLFINISAYQERPAEIFFQTRKALIRFRHRQSLTQ